MCYCNVFLTNGSKMFSSIKSIQKFPLLVWKNKLLTEALVNNYKFWVKYKKNNYLKTLESEQKQEILKGVKTWRKNQHGLRFRFLQFYPEGSWGTRGSSHWKVRGNFQKGESLQRGTPRFVYKFCLSLLLIPEAHMCRNSDLSCQLLQVRGLAV